ncbi:HAD family hydrolase [candidate division KSB1 bacterium]|nr:HAD family hydrolase [candidate division KSB1 bacterium]
MIEAVLFDIDNTLILFDETKFFEAYISKLTPVYVDVFSPEEFYKRLIGGSRAMLRNNGQKSNADYYMNTFCHGMGEKREEFWNRFERFYDTEFDAFSDLVTPIEGVSEIFNEIHEIGLKIVIASHPLWPERVQQIRLNWAGLDGFPYDWITHIENTKYCKPQVEYYQEISDSIQIPPEKCLMVGNDPVNDMVAGLAGMKTYLVTDAKEQGFESFPMSQEIREQVHQPIPNPDFTGLLSDVPYVVAKLLSSS